MSLFMNKSARRTKADILTTLFLSVGFGLYADLFFQSASFTMERHAFILRPLSVLFLTGLGALCFFALFSVFSRPNPAEEKQHNIRGRWCWTRMPLLFLFAAPFLPSDYLTRGDLRQRLSFLGLAVLAAFVLLASPGSVLQVRLQDFTRKVMNRFQTAPLRRRLFVLFITGFLVYNLCAAFLVSRGATFSGDEPYYLLTTHSLYQDQDINVWNNYARKDYFSFYEKGENPNLELGMYAREGRKGDKAVYPINLSGISFLMLPHYWLAQQVSGPLRTILLKGSLSLWAVLLGLQLYLFCLERWGRDRLSLRLWALYSFTAPVLFYAVHLYPEIPIAFFSLYIYRKVRLGKNLTPVHILFLGCVPGLFLWFGLKYNMIFFPLVLVGLYSLWKEQRAGWKSLLFLAGPGLSLVLFYIYIFTLYGSFYPFSIYEGVMTPEKITAFKEMIVGIPVLLRIDTFFDYFLDQRDGLLLYAPFYLFGFLGMIEAFRKARKDFWILLFISAPFILNYAFFSHRQGHCPQGRIIAPISWVAAVFIGYFLVYNSKKIYARFFVWLSAASVAVVFVLLRNPSFLYQPTTHDHLVRPGDLFISLSNIRFFLPDYLPSFIKTDNLGHIPNFIWIGAILGFIGFYILGKKETAGGSMLRTGSVLILLVFALFLQAASPRTVLYPTRVFTYSDGTELGYYMFPMGKDVIAHRAAELFLHRDGRFTIPFSSRKPLSGVRILFGSEEGEFDVRLSLFDSPVFKGRVDHTVQEIDVASSSVYRYRRLYLYQITLNIDQLSEESMKRNPFFFQVIPLTD